MRLRWQAGTPRATADRLATVLGPPDEAIWDHVVFHLANATLEVAAGPPRGDPAGAADDRLALLPEDPDQQPSRERPVPVRVAAIGFASVDAQRFAAERGWQIISARRDAVLGAAASVVAGEARSGLRGLVLEPDTEGRIAASLARLGEGPAVLYLLPAGGLDEVRKRINRHGGRVTGEGAGPFGRAFALVGGAPWGPHVVVVESDASLPSTDIPD